MSTYLSNQPGHAFVDLAYLREKGYFKGVKKKIGEVEYNHSEDLEKKIHSSPMETKALLEDEPICMVCPSCSEVIITNISYHAGTLSWFICGLLIFLGLWMGCCIIPFYVDALKDCVHSCPNCLKVLGKCTRL